ncbi:diguanylate cyclase (GGDEF) domain-containing protein [Caloramator fervidus]|uniref:Diguanylate cyclase (GGDEF) domain-containing protein n=2 Tax=Caloramator fervidus TaxID=29344 RepID=A0A1H5RQW0_9CLOT|nr:diguanylate cyclase (GGDEF) domain-containing protein [Caloramator fervidus]
MRMFLNKYKSYLKDYIFNGGDETILMNAFDELLEFLDPTLSEAVNILDVHVKALEDVLNVDKDNDLVQWIYIQRANEFLAQIFMYIDSMILSLREEVERDALTGLNNRLALSRILSSLWFEYKKNKKSLSLALLDLDNFKKVNDTYGHIVGDKVLKEVANVLKSNTRGNDIAFRFGGEEFIVLFPNSNCIQAKVPAERIRKQVEDLIITDYNIRITVSIGIASLEDNPESMDELIRFADDAMYQAKSEGKNRIVLYKDIKGIIMQ